MRSSLPALAFFSLFFLLVPTHIRAGCSCPQADYCWAGGSGNWTDSAWCYNGVLTTLPEYDGNDSSSVYATLELSTGSVSFYALPSTEEKEFYFFGALSISNNSSLVVEDYFINDGALELSAGGTLIVNTGGFAIGGTLDVLAGGSVQVNGVLENAGTLDINADATCFVTGSVLNEFGNLTILAGGLLTISSSASLSSLFASVVIEPGGVLNVLNGGSVTSGENSTYVCMNSACSSGSCCPTSCAADGSCVNGGTLTIATALTTTAAVSVSATALTSTAFASGGATGTRTAASTSRVTAATAATATTAAAAAWAAIVRPSRSLVAGFVALVALLCT